jgi:hypothetical protein
MWDVTCEHARRELRQAEEMGEATDWKGYIPVGGELLPPDEEQNEEEWVGQGHLSMCQTLPPGPVRDEL